MSVALPDWPGPASATPRYLDFGRIMRPDTGSPAIRINRLGDRHGLRVTLPPLSVELGMRWVSKLIAAQREGAVYEWPLFGFEPGVPGAVMADGGTGAGMSIAIRGGTPGYMFRDGQFLSIIIAGQRYLYSLRADALVAANGRVALPIQPMIRKTPPDGAVFEIVKPMIEGFVVGNAREWELMAQRCIGITFDIEERA